MDTITPIETSNSARQGRIDLAAALRLAVHYGYNEGIDNHFTLSLPDAPSRYLLNPFGMHWSEVRASDLMEIDLHGHVVTGDGFADQTATCIHGPIHRRGVACVLHTHMPFATALTQLEDMTIEMAGQNAIGFHGEVAYDYDYNGLALDPAEGERMADILDGKTVLMLANHGVIVVGRSVAQAFHTLYFLERTCQTQVLAMSTGKPRRILSEAVLAKTRGQYGHSGLPSGDKSYDYHFRALKRGLDRREPDYAA